MTRLNAISQTLLTFLKRIWVFAVSSTSPAFRAAAIGLVMAGYGVLFPAIAIAGPFTCDGNIYQVQSGQLKIFDPITSTYVDIGTPQGGYNAAGYNSNDDYAYGVRSSDVYRIHGDGTIEKLYDTNFSSFAGDVDNSDQLWLRRTASRYTAVNLLTGATNTVNFTGPTVNAADVAYIQDGTTNYLIAPSTTAIGYLNLDTGVSTTRPVTGITDTGGFGASWTDKAGRMFTFNNGTGRIFEIFDLFTAAPYAEFVAQGAPSGSNDGFACIKEDFPNLPPLAFDDDYLTPVDVPVTSNVLQDNGNNADEDPENGILTVNTTPVSGPSNGSVVLSANGDFTYTPAPGFFGTDTFDYIISDPSGLTATATVTILIEKAELSITKLASKDTDAEAGDVITYTYEVENTGNVTLNNVFVTDVHSGTGTLSAITPASVSLNEGESQTFTATYTVTQADIEAETDLTNTATASASPVTGAIIEPTADEVVDLIDAAPALTFTKTASDDADVAVGTVITYTYAAENTGNVTMTGVSVSDVHSGTGTLSPITPASVDLAPGESQDFTATYTVTQDDIDDGSDITNTATLAATPAAGNYTPVTADEVVDLADVIAAMTMVKTASDTTDVEVGDIITYTYAVENTGNVNMTGVSVSDVHSGSGTLSAITPASVDLAPGAMQDFTATYTVTQADIDAGTDITNTATLAASPAAGSYTPVTADESVDIDDAAPAMTMVKTASDTTDVQEGDVITYTYAVENTGNVSMSGVSVSDVHSGAGSLSAITPAGVDLAPGETQDFTATYTVTQADIDAGTDITNTATLAANPAAGSYTPVTADESIDIDDAAPAMTMVKTASDTTDVLAGDIITYTYAVVNTGNVSMSGVSVSDMHSGTGTLSAVMPASVTLAPGASQDFTATYTVTQADIDAGTDITNTATLAANPATGSYTPVTADESVDIDDAAPAMTMVKTASDTTDVQAGDMITYTYAVANTGNVSMSGVSVSDVHSGAGTLSAITPASVDLAPGETQDFTATYTVTQDDIDAGADITNTATLAANPATGSYTPVTADESVDIEDPAAAMTMAKTASDTTDVESGDVITYSYDVVNTGNVTMTGVSVSDVHSGTGTLSAITPASVTLLPGQAQTFSATYTVRQDDIDAGSDITNTASLTASSTQGPFGPVTADESVDIDDAAPAMTMVKTASDMTDVKAGDVITYTYAVENTGNVTMSGVSVSDMHSGSGSLSAITPASVTLAPGASQDFTATYTVTQDDIDAGVDITNTATLAASPAQGSYTPVTADESVDIDDAAPAMTMVKTASDTTDVLVGDVITYTYAVTNIGNVTMSGVSVSDMHSGSGSLSAITPASVTLAPGASQDFTATYTVTQDDIDAGTDITNTATLAATPATGSYTPVTADESVDIADPAPAMTLTKAASFSMDAKAGDLVTYTYVATNTGNVTMTGVSVSDVHSGTGSLSAITPAAVTLVPGASQTFTATYAITQDDIDAGTDITNTASLAATPAQGSYTPVTADASVDLDDPAPAATMTKVADNKVNVGTGQLVTYTYTVTNTGNITLDNVSVSDVHLGSAALSAITPASVATLGVGDSAAFQATYTITQDDVDAGIGITNEATLSATPRLGDLPVVQAFESVDLVDSAPQMSLVKTASDDSDVSAGDVITYSYVVQNTGNVTINNITVTDMHSGSAALSAITPASIDLTPGASQTFTATYTVTQADIDAATDITNVATATGDPMSGTLSDVQATERVDIENADPNVDFTKTASATSDVSVGDVITYTYAARNTGNVTLANVSVSDVHSGAGALSAITPASVTLQPGETQDFTATYIVTQADIDAGVDITNTATLSADPASGSLAPATATEVVDLDDAAPQMVVTKTASDTVDVAAGDVITYTYTAANTGNVTINNVSVTDVHSGAGTLSAITPVNVAVLAIGETASFTATYTVTQADIDAATDITNTATFDATPASGALPVLEAGAVVDVDDADPMITFTKVASDTINAQLGDEITYTYTAVNTGNVSMTDVSVSDVHTGTGTLSPISPANVPSLPVGATAVFTANYIITQDDIDAGADVTNIATVAATPAAGTLPPTSADAAVSPQAAAPSVTFVKTALGTDFAAVGDMLDYEYLVTNTGNVTLTAITVSDDKIATVTCPVTTLLPNENVTCTATYAVTQDDLNMGSVTNNASVSANAPDGPVAPVSDDAVVSGSQTPSLTLEKIALDTSFAMVGDMLDYEYLVINTGNVEITNLSVTDDKIANVTCPVTVLAPAAQTTCLATYTVIQADIDAGSVTNNALANGTPAGGDLTPAGDDATVSGDQMPALALEKTALSTSYTAVGDRVDYEYLVTNTGNVTLTNAITVQDDKITAPAIVTCPALPAGGLAPTQSLTCEATHIVTQADLDAGSITNIASATDGTATSPQDSATVNAVQTPALSLDKAAVDTTFAVVGDDVNYTYTVENTGNVLVSNLVVTDNLIATILCNVSGVGNNDPNLDPGEIVICTGVYEVTQADIDAGSVTNIASLTATPAGGTLTPPTDTVTVDATQSPALSMTKTANETDFAAVGDVLTYDYVVTNTGNVLIADLAVTDDKIANVVCDVTAVGNNDANLDPAESVTCTASYTVTQSDIDAGGVTNIAAATGMPSGGDLTAAQASETVDADQMPAMNIVKTATDINFELPGDITTYEYVVTNTGNTTLTDPITVSDNLVTVTCPALPAAGLAPLAGLTCTSSYTVTQADLDSGSVTNLATASSGSVTSAQTSETIPADQDPALTIAKRAISTDFDAAGDVLSYEFDVTNSGNLTLTGGIDVVDDKIGTIACVTGNLVPGATQTCSATYIVTQADMDAGFVTNQAFGENGALTSPVVDATITGTFAPGLSFDKRSVDTVMATVGDILTYAYDVENTGNVTISGLTVTDDKIANVSCPVTTLLPAATATCTASYTVTQADLDAGSVTNIASADGVPAGGSFTPPQDTVIVTADQMPSLSFDKRAIDTEFTMAGDILDYEYDVVNTGNVTLTGVVVTDNLIASIMCPKTDLDPAEAMTCQGSYAVTQDDVDAGTVTNIAGVDAVPAGGTLTPQTDTATVGADQMPRLTLMKTASAAEFTMPGEVISYDYVVSNTGNVTVSAITVSDDKIATVTCPVAVLLPGTQTTCTADYTTVQADVDAGFVANNALANGTAPGENPAPASARAIVDAAQTPALTLVKTALDTDFSMPGETLSYEYLVTNSGNTTITSRIVVSDDKIASVSCPALPAGGLRPAQSLTCSAVYVVTQADIDFGSVVNLASASDGTITSPEDSATVSGTQSPSMAVIKTAAQSSFASVDEIVSYDYVVTNTGNTTITAPINVNDDKIAAVSCPMLPSGGLVPGAALTCTADYAITQADLDAGGVTNIASATDGATTSPDVSRTVPAAQTPALSLVKTAGTATFVNAGDSVVYNYVVTNTGNVTLTSAVTVSDDKIAGVSCPAIPSAGFAPDMSLTCSATYVVSQADIDAGFVTNIAAASSGAVTSPDATETVAATQTPALSVTKTARDTRFDSVGDVITYDYRVRNTGNVSFVGNITVSDDKITTVNCPALPMSGLSPNTEIMCSATYLITQADLDTGLVTNIASATATPAGGAPITSPEDTATTTADQIAALTVIKTAAQSTYRLPDDILTYTYLVTNTGNVTIMDTVSVSDDKIPSVTCPAIPAGGLVPNASVTCSGTYAVTQADIDAGAVVNIASAQAGPVTSPDVTERVVGTRREGLEVVKTATDIQFTLPGDITTYEYVVTNTGTVTVTSPISVMDNRIANVSCPPLPAGGLLPNDTLTCNADYVVTQDDLNVGVVTNVASATDGNVTSALTSETVPGNVNPAMEMEKSATGLTEFSRVGDILDYSYNVVNTGNVTLTGNIDIIDNKIGRFNCFAGNFVPGADVTCTAQYTVLQSDIDAGFVTNDAYAENSRASSPPDFVTLPARQTPALSLVKSAATSDYAAVGDVISYDYLVTNSGNTTITFPISVTDDKIASVSCPALPAGGLLPAQSITCRADYSVTQADIDAGFVTNIAMATDGFIAPVSATETVDAVQMPALAIAKLAQSSDFNAVGDVLSYTYIVTNTGNVTITSAITVSDDKIETVTCPALPAGGLLPNASLTCLADYSVTQADLNLGRVVNIASATDGSIISPQDTATITGTQTPSLEIVKTARESEYAGEGDILTYDYDVTNTGNITIMTPITVSDDKIENVICQALPSEGLLPAQTLTCSAAYTVTQADIDGGSVTNLAGASAGAIESPIVSETVNAAQAPVLTLAKTALTTTFAAVGDVIDYRFVVTNAGNTTITRPVSINDNRIGLVSCPALPAGGLLPAQTLTCLASDSVTQADLDSGTITNIASATDGNVTSAPVTETVNGAQTAGLAIVKTATVTDFAAVGDILSYEYIVTNSGNVTLTAPITVNDDKISSVTCPALPAGGLVPNATLTCAADYAVSQIDIDAGFVTNIASATDGTNTSAQTSVTVDGTQAPALTVVKTAAESTFDTAGDVLNYSYLVTNTGNVTLTSALSITDDKIASVTCPALPAGGLLPQAMLTCTAPYSVTQADVNAGFVTNIASATDGTTTSPEVSVTVSGEQMSGLSIVKTATRDTFAAMGDILPYEYVVTNIGNVTVTDAITVSDDKIANVICPALPAGGLLPQAALTCAADYTVVQADIDAGFVTNIASASDGITASNPDSVTVNAARDPMMVVTKSVSDPIQVGGPVYDVRYTLTMQNTGNVTLTDLGLTDPLADVLAPATLMGTPVVAATGFDGSGSVNADFDGAADVQLLSGDNRLLVGSTATITIDLRIDTTIAGPAQPNTAIGSAPQLPGDVASNDPTVTPGTPGDVNPTQLTIVDSDGDGVPDIYESADADRDGDGIPDSEDYDPTGYFYCEENGNILSGGGISVSGPAGSNATIGTANNITIVQDGSNGFYQFYVTRPGRYTLSPTYPTSGVPSTDRPVQGVALDATNLLPANPGVLGSSESGSTGRLADFSRAQNDPYYFEFDIAAGDPAILMNNIPMKFCGAPAITAEKVADADPVLQEDGRHLVSYTLSAQNAGETQVENVNLADDLGAVFGADNVEVTSVTLTQTPVNFAATVNAGYNGTSDTALLTTGGILLAGERVSAQLTALVQPTDTGVYENIATVTASAPLDDAWLVADDMAAVTINSISDASRLTVTKTARPRTVQIGDPVLYTIGVTNETLSDMGDLRITDHLPSGFSYVPGSATLSDGATSFALEPAVQGRGVLTWDVTSLNAAPFNGLGAGESLDINLRVMAGPNVTFGAHQNRAYVESLSTGTRSEVATATVDYIPEPTFDCTPVIGRVFDDVNHNGYPDDGEPGLPSVRLVTVNGDIITTDEHGRYHIPCATIADSERGSNFLLKTDVRSLPLGYAPTSENPRVVRATRGKFVKMNFAAAYMPKVRVDVYAADFDDASGKLLDGAASRIFGMLKSMPNAQRGIVIYHARDDEPAANASKRLDLVRSYIGELPTQLTDIALQSSWGEAAMYNPDAPSTAGHGYTHPSQGERRIERTYATLLDDNMRPEGFNIDRDHDGGRSVNTGQRGDINDDAYDEDTHAGLPGRSESGAYESSRPSRLARWIGWTKSSTAYAQGMEIETTVDALDPVKRLNVSADIVSENGENRRIIANTYSNYGAFIARSEIRLFKDGMSVRSEPSAIAEVTAQSATLNVADMSGDYLYVLRVYDAKGSFDETSPKRLDIGDVEFDISTQEARERSDDAFGADTLAMDNIRVRGGAVRVYGRNVPGERASVFGQSVRIDHEGRFVAEMLLPSGAQSVDIIVDGQNGAQHKVTRNVTVKDKDTFFVGLVEATIGERVNPDAAGDTDYTQGRAAFYVRSRINDKYRITATADTGEGDIDGLFDNLNDKDVRHLLRRLDPDRHYPVYGDDSVIEEDAPTSGKFYARIEREDDYALWGNYRLSFNDTEYGRVNRTLYGAKLRWDSNGNPTGYGDDRSVIEAFVAQGGSRAARDELRGTGGSVYYLRHGDINIGGEIVRVETRDEISGLVTETRRLVYGTDYDMDFIQGRILLSRPLSSTGSSSSVFRTGTNGGNAQILVVDYEYTPVLGDDDSAVFGARGSHWVNDMLKLGLTYNHDSDGGADSDLLGADVTLQFDAGTYIKAEAAQSEGRGVSTYSSNDGGFSYARSSVLGINDTAMAYALEASGDLNEMGLADSGRVYAYWRDREAGFAGYGEGSNTDITQFGGGLEVKLSERMKLRGRADISDDQTQGTNSFGELSADYAVNETITVSGGLAYNDDGRGNSGTSLGLKAEAKLSEDNKVYIFGQANVSGDNTRATDRIGLGAEHRVSEKLYAGGEVSTGEDGLGARASLRYERKDGDEMYISYELPLRANTGDNYGSLNLGGRRRYSDALSVFGEERFHYDGTGLSGLTHAYGLNYSPITGWSMGLSGEIGEVEDIDRKAISASAGFKDEYMTAGIEGEYRTDENLLTGDVRNTWLLRTSALYRPNDELRLQAKYNMAFSDANNDALGLGDFNQAQFTEGSLAAAYRPIWDDRFNLLAKFVYLEDLSPSAQRFGGETINYRQRSQITSLDASYDLSEKWTLGGKYGFRSGELTASRASDEFEKSQAELYVARLDWHVVNNWDALFEARYLDIGDGVTTREGGLVGLYRHVNDNVKLGGGLVWGGVEEEYLAAQEDTDMGWYLNLVGKF